MNTVDDMALSLAVQLQKLSQCLRTKDVSEEATVQIPDDLLKNTIPGASCWDDAVDLAT